MVKIKRSLIKAMEKIGANFHLTSALHVQRAQCTQCAYAIALDFNIKFCDTYIWTDGISTWASTCALVKWVKHIKPNNQKKSAKKWKKIHTERELDARILLNLALSQQAFYSFLCVLFQWDHWIRISKKRLKWKFTPAIVSVLLCCAAKYHIIYIMLHTKNNLRRIYWQMFYRLVLAFESKFKWMWRHISLMHIYFWKACFQSATCQKYTRHEWTHKFLCSIQCSCLMSSSEQLSINSPWTSAKY